MRREPIQPLPPGAQAPRLRADGQRCCHDCAAADTLVRLDYVPDWDMARTVVANDRQEQLRLPGALMGLVQMGLVRPSAEGDFERHHAWLEQNNATLAERSECPERAERTEQRDDLG